MTSKYYIVYDLIWTPANFRCSGSRLKLPMVSRRVLGPTLKHRLGHNPEDVNVTKRKKEKKKTTECHTSLMSTEVNLKPGFDTSISPNQVITWKCQRRKSGVKHYRKKKKSPSPSLKQMGPLKSHDLRSYFHLIKITLDASFSLAFPAVYGRGWGGEAPADGRGGSRNGTFHRPWTSCASGPRPPHRLTSLVAPHILLRLFGHVTPDAAAFTAALPDDHMTS